MLSARFSWNWPSGSEEDENVKSLRQSQQRRQQQRLTLGKFGSQKLTWAFESGELKRNGRQSLDAVRKVLNFGDEGGSIFKDSENRISQLIKRYVKEILKSTVFRLTQLWFFCSEWSNTDNSCFGPSKFFINPTAVSFVPPNKIWDNDALYLAEAVVKKSNDISENLHDVWHWNIVSWVFWKTSMQTH